MKLKNTIISLVALALTLALAGCAPVLTAKDVKATLDAGEWAYSLAGDKALLEGEITLPKGTSSKLIARVEKKDTAGKWQNIAEQETSTDAFKGSFEVTLAEEETSDYRLAVYGSDKKLITVSPAVKIVVKDFSKGLRNLFYDMSQACQQSEKACFNAFIASDYPGLFKFSASQKEKLQSKYIWTSSPSTPDPSTAIPTPEWVLPLSGCEKEYVSMDVTKPLPGRTFMVSDGNRDSHITYLKGEFYIYNVYC